MGLKPMTLIKKFDARLQQDWPAYARAMQANSGKTGDGPSSGAQRRKVSSSAGNGSHDEATASHIPTFGPDDTTRVTEAAVPTEQAESDAETSTTRSTHRSESPAHFGPEDEHYDPSFEHDHGDLDEHSPSLGVRSRRGSIDSRARSSTPTVCLSPSLSPLVR